MPIPDRIERTIDLARPPQRVWEALTSAEGPGGWFGDRATVDLRPGGTAYVEWDDGDHKATLTISVVEPPVRFAWTWGSQGLPATDPRPAYSADERGLDGLWGMYQWPDRAPPGRNETGFWWRRHDEYDSCFPLRHVLSLEGATEPGPSHRAAMSVA